MLNDITKQLITRHGVLLINLKRDEEDLLNTLFSSFMKLKKTHHPKLINIIIVCPYHRHSIRKWREKISLYKITDWDFKIINYVDFVSDTDKFYDKDKVNYLILDEASYIIKYLTDLQISSRVYKRCFRYEKKIIINNNFVDTKLTDVLLFTIILSNEIRDPYRTKSFRDIFEMKNLLLFPLSSFFFILCVLFLILNIFLLKRNLDFISIKIILEYMKGKGVSEENIILQNKDSEKPLITLFRDVFFDNNETKIKKFLKKNTSDDIIVDSSDFYIDHKLSHIHDLSLYNPFHVSLYIFYTQILPILFYKLFNIFVLNSFKLLSSKKGEHRIKDIDSFLKLLEDISADGIRGYINTKLSLNIFQRTLMPLFVTDQDVDLITKLPIIKEFKNYLKTNSKTINENEIKYILETIDNYNFQDPLSRINLKKFDRNEKKQIWKYVTITKEELRSDVFVLKNNIFKDNQKISDMFVKITQNLSHIFLSGFKLEKNIDNIYLRHIHFLNKNRLNSELDYDNIINIYRDRLFFRYHKRVLLEYIERIYNTSFIILTLIFLKIVIFIYNYLKNKFSVSSNYKNIHYAKMFQILRHQVIIFPNQRRL